MPFLTHAGIDRRRGLARPSATAALALFIYALLALASLHVLRPDYAPATNFVSNYAIGPYGWVMTSFFLAFSAGLSSLVVGLAASGVRGALGTTGLVALLVTAAGLVVTAIFPTDLPGATLTRSGDIHELSFRVNVVALLLGVLAISAALDGVAAWRPYRLVVRALAITTVVALVLQFATLRKGLPYGLANRLFVIAVFAWALHIAYRLRGLSTAGRLSRD